jgi:hypothetical protein
MMRVPLAFDAQVRGRMKKEGIENQSAFWRKAMVFYLAQPDPEPGEDTGEEPDEDGGPAPSRNDRTPPTTPPRSSR